MTGRATEDDDDADLTDACATCARVRVFLMVAAFLIVLLGWRPSAAIAVAAALPGAGVIGGAIVVVATVAFVARYLMWRRSTTR